MGARDRNQDEKKCGRESTKNNGRQKSKWFRVQGKTRPMEIGGERDDGFGRDMALHMMN